MTTAVAAKNGKTPDATAEQTSTVTIRRISKERLLIPIRGTASLIVHNWSEKAKLQMLDATQGKKKIKEPKDPNADFESSLYRLPDGGYGIPALSFKNAMVSGARYFGKDLTMVQVRQAIFVAGIRSADKTPVQLTPIQSDGGPIMREDMVRVGMGGTDLRYRGEFWPWTAVVDLTYVKSLLDQGSVISLLEAAGFGVGVCEWRPERSGANGTFEIDPDRDIEVISS